MVNYEETLSNSLMITKLQLLSSCSDSTLMRILHQPTTLLPWFTGLKDFAMGTRLTVDLSPGPELWSLWTWSVIVRKHSGSHQEQEGLDKLVS